jgi:uncharacterized cupin superfamily protein
MGYHVLDPATLPATDDHPCDRRSVSEAVDLETLAAAVYELAPGEQLSRTYHYHEQREELFAVLDGELTVETPEGEYTIPEGQLFVSEPKSPIRPHNPADAAASVRVLGVGAPQYDIGRPYDPEGDTDPGE